MLLAILVASAITFKPHMLLEWSSNYAVAAGTGKVMCSLDGYWMFAIVLVLLSAILQKILVTCGCFVCWLRSSLWLQFKPHQIAAGAAYLAAKSLNMDLSSCQNVWQEFHTPPAVLKDVVQQLVELF